MPTYFEIAEMLDRTATLLQEAAKGLRQAHLALSGITSPSKKYTWKDWETAPISVRTRKILEKLGVDSIEKLAEKKAWDFVEQRGCGTVMMRELRQFLLSVGKDFPDWDSYVLTTGG